MERRKRKTYVLTEIGDQKVNDALKKQDVKPRNRASWLAEKTDESGDSISHDTIRKILSRQGVEESYIKYVFEVLSLQGKEGNEWERVLRQQSDPSPNPTNQIATEDLQKSGSLEFDVIGQSETFAHRTSQAWTVYEENIWVGRTEQSQLLCEKILSDCRITIILGITGIGKTALAEKIAHETQQKWDQIVRVNFDDDKVSESFLEAAKSLLNQFGITPTSDDYKKTDGLFDLLTYNVQSRQVLLIVDSLEFILSENAQREQIFQDDLWYKFFKCLLTTDSCKGRVILTSQVLPSVIEQVASRYSQYFYKSVMSGLTNLEQLELFDRSGLDITENSESRKYLTQMGTVYEGHPLCLRTIIGEIQELFFGNVLAYWDRYSEEFERVERDLMDVDSHSGIDDKWILHRLSSPMENKVQFRLQQTLLRLKESCYSAYCLLCEASVFRGTRLERQWINQFEDRVDLPVELSNDGIRVALNKLYAWYLVESELQQNKRYIRLHNLVRSIALEHLDNLS